MTVQYRKLGPTGLDVSVVCFGGMTAGGTGTFGEQEDEKSEAAVRAALELGINFIDTAEGYGDGHSEEVIGRALKGRREEAVISTKVSRANLPGELLERSCENSLQRLQTDYIDLYLVHWPNHGLPFADTAGRLEGLKESGKIRHWGVSNFGREDLTGAVEAGPPVANQLPYSLLWRVIEHDIVPICVEHEVGIMCYSPMAQGILSGKFARPKDVPPQRSRARYCKEAMEESFAVVDELRSVSNGLGEPMVDVALAWVLAQPGITSVVTGVRDAEQLSQNARAAELTLPEDVLTRLTRVSYGVKDALDTNPDMWQAGDDSRYR
jgi:aryl-alcohol dehydrogenase-like predicted oxidoreductase